MKWEAPGWSGDQLNRVYSGYGMHSRSLARDVSVTGMLVWMPVPCTLTSPGSWDSRMGFNACIIGSANNITEVLPGSFFTRNIPWSNPIYQY